MRLVRDGILTVFFSAALQFATPAHANDWGSYRSDRFGYTLYFPSDVFHKVGASANGDGVEFASWDGRAKLKVFGAYNTDNVDLAGYRNAVMQSFRGYDRMEYGPMGATWFVLSGVREASIYYQKVVFSCGGRVINAFAFTYPIGQKRDYDAIVTGIEKTFRPATGPSCYSDDR